MHVAVVERRLDPAALIAQVARPDHGATALFLGAVRDHHDGKDVARLEYSAYVPMAIAEMERIAAETIASHGEVAIAIEHRIGALEVGEVSIVVAVSHAHRDAAFDAARYIVEELKRRVPVWKREHFIDEPPAWVQAGVGSATTPR